MEDLVDGQNVLYLGRSDFRPIRSRNGENIFTIFNCVYLSIANPEIAKTADEVIYEGVGLSIKYCKHSMFLCHG